MWKKIVIAFFAVILIAIAAGYFYLPKYATQKFYQALEKADSVHFKNLELDFWSGHISVDSLYLSDTAGLIFGVPIHAEIAEIKILHINTRKLLLRKHLQVDTVRFSSGQVAAIFTSENDSIKSPHPKKKNPLKSIEIGNTHLDSLTFDFLFHPTDTSVHAKGMLQAIATEMYIPLKKPEDFNAESIDFSITDLYAQNNDGITYYHVKEIGLNDVKHELLIRDIHIKQRLKTYEYARHFGFDKLHFEIDADSIAFRKLAPVKTLMQNIRLPKIDIYAPMANLFKDKRYKHKSHRRKFPFEALADASLPFDIDTITVNDGALYFKALSRDDGKTAKINLTSVNAEICQVSSNPNSPFEDWTKINARVVFYHQLKFDFTWKFDRRRNGKSFLFDGKFGRAPLAIWNSFIENKIDMRFKSGTLLSGRLLAEGNTINGEGTLDFFYKDMKIDILKKQDHQTDFGLDIMGGATNLIIRNNNLPDKNPKTGIVYAEPRQDRFVIDFLWRLLQSGIKDIMMPTNNDRKAEERSNEYLKN